MPKRPGEHTDGTAAIIDQARAWAAFLSKRTEANFEAWRDQRDWTQRKYAMWEAGERVPSQKPLLSHDVPLRRDLRFGLPFTC